MDACIKQIRLFHQNLVTAKFRELLRQKSLFDIRGVGRKENGHSNFLSWFLGTN